jgi:hypothetical protein
MNEIKRMCIYSKDVMQITGKSERADSKLLNQINKYLQKETYQFVTILKFSTYSGIDKSTIETYIKD